jgi:hypothetical protein
MTTSRPKELEAAFDARAKRYLFMGATELEDGTLRPREKRASRPKNCGILIRLAALAGGSIRMKRTEQSESQIAFFDARIVPFLAGVEDRAEPPFGQSLFAVVVKAPVGT